MPTWTHTFALFASHLARNGANSTHLNSMSDRKTVYKTGLGNSLTTETSKYARILWMAEKNKKKTKSSIKQSASTRLSYDFSWIIHYETVQAVNCVCLVDFHDDMMKYCDSNIFPAFFSLLSFNNLNLLLFCNALNASYTLDIYLFVLSFSNIISSSVICFILKNAGFAWAILFFSPSIT